MAYDETLRIDTVQKSIEEIAEILSNTFENKNEVNSLVSLLGITAATVSNTPISKDTELILQTLKGFESRINYVEARETRTFAFQKPAANIELPIDAEQLLSSDLLELGVGDVIFHVRLGKGEVVRRAVKTLQGVRIVARFADGRNLLINGNSKLLYKSVSDEPL